MLDEQGPLASRWKLIQGLNLCLTFGFHVTVEDPNALLL